MKGIISISAICAIIINTHASDLGTITVSTTNLGQEQSVYDVHASVEVFDENFIKQTSSKSLPQVLNEALGIDVKDAGSTSSISIRGFNSNHNLILVDGMRISGKYGSSDLSSISLGNIEKIEIIKGPMSALYGADAISGVINVITKKQAKKDYIKASILGGQAQNGQRETGIVKLNAAKVIDNITHNLSLEIREKNKYRYDDSSIDTDLKNESRKFINYINFIKFNEKNTLSTKLEFANQDDDGLNYASNVTSEKENRYHASAQYAHTSENYLIDINLGYSYSDAEVDRGSGIESTDYKQTELNTYFRHFTTENMTNIFGIGYKNEEIEVSMYTQDASRNNYNVLFQNDYNILENLVSSVGIRYDDYSDFGDATNPKISLMYKYDDFKLRAGYGKAFKAPSFTNMYSHFTRSAGPVLYDISGNKNLKPEESKTFEYSLGYNNKYLSIDLTHHRTKLNNLIESYTANVVGKTNYTTYRNIANASINGTEFSLKYNLNNKFTTRVAVENLDTKDELTGQRLIGSAKTSIKANFSYRTDDLGIYLNIKKYKDYYGTDENRKNVLSNYTVTDLKTDYKINDNIELFFGIDNIQDKIMPYNMTSRGTPNDPGERYYYTGLNINI